MTAEVLGSITMELPPLIINAAITGMIPMRADTPHVPLTVEEIIADARRCFDAGATVCHVHARDAEGKPTVDRETWGGIIEGIKAECPELMISGSTSGRLHKTYEDRSTVLSFRPHFCSLTPGVNELPQDGFSE